MDQEALYRALEAAVVDGQTAEVEELIASDRALVQLPTRTLAAWGVTASLLWHACQHPSRGVARVLLGWGADANVGTIHKAGTHDPLLVLLFSLNDLEFAEELIQQHDVDPTGTDVEGQPLFSHIANAEARANFAKRHGATRLIASLPDFALALHSSGGLGLDRVFDRVASFLGEGDG